METEPIGIGKCALQAMADSEATLSASPSIGYWVVTQLLTSEYGVTDIPTKNNVRMVAKFRSSVNIRGVRRGCCVVRWRDTSDGHKVAAIRNSTGAAVIALRAERAPSAAAVRSVRSI